jgi:hypothetical protein
MAGSLATGWNYVVRELSRRRPLHPIQALEMRRSFYMGAQCAISTLTAAAARGSDVAEAERHSTAALNDLTDEILSFMADVREGAA